MEKKIGISGFFDNFSGEGKIAQSQLQCRERSMFSFQVGRPLHPHFVFQPKKLRDTVFLCSLICSVTQKSTHPLTITSYKHPPQMTPMHPYFPKEYVSLNILITCLLDDIRIFWGEVSCWSFLRVKELIFRFWEIYHLCPSLKAYMGHGQQATCSRPAYKKTQTNLWLGCSNFPSLPGRYQLCKSVCCKLGREVQMTTISSHGDVLVGKRF